MKLHLCVLLFVAVDAAKKVESTVKMTVHYQHNEVSIKFITHQLYPTFVTLNKPLPQRLKLELVPYEDNTCDNNVSADRSIACLNSKIHACATSVFHGNWDKLKFINCIAIEGYSKSAECAITTCLDDSPMAACVNSYDGDGILAEYNNRTQELRVPLNLFPIILFNGIYQEEEQRTGRINLLSLLCKKFKNVFSATYCNTPRAHKDMIHDNFATGFFYPEKRVCYYW